MAPRVMIGAIRTIFDAPSSDSNPTPPPPNQLQALECSHGSEGDRSPLFFPSSPAPDGNTVLGVRRRRSDSLDNDTSGSFNVHTQKRLKTYAHRLTMSFNLPQGALDELVEAKDLATMVLASHAAILSARRVQRRYENLVKLQDKEFCTTITNRLIGLLLSPDISAYLHAIHPHTMSLIVMNPEEFAIPDDMVTDPDVLHKLSELITRLLTRARSYLKSKIQASLGKKRKGSQNLVALSRAMLPSSLSIELRSAHMERIAWLRALLVDFSEQQNTKAASQSGAATTAPAADVQNDALNSPEGADENTDESTDENAEDGSVDKPKEANDKAYKESQYWAFVDDCMLATRQEFCDKYGGDPVKLQTVWRQAMASVLANDLKLYPSPDNAPVKPSYEDRRVALFPWQKFYEDNSTWP